MKNKIDIDETIENISKETFHQNIENNSDDKTNNSTEINSDEKMTQSAKTISGEKLTQSTEIISDEKMTNWNRIVSEDNVYQSTETVLNYVDQVTKNISLNAIKQTVDTSLYVTDQINDTQIVPNSTNSYGIPTTSQKTELNLFNNNITSDPASVTTTTNTIETRSISDASKNAATTPTEVQAAIKTT